ncbi:5848_t:CDS:1, partial [Dentiscutata heterogama]
QNVIKDLINQKQRSMLKSNIQHESTPTLIKLLHILHHLGSFLGNDPPRLVNVAAAAVLENKRTWFR